MANAPGGRDKVSREPKLYAHYLQITDYHLLNDWCMLVNRMFSSDAHYGLYLVGSVLKSKDWRDVDIRLIMPDDVYAAKYDDEKRKYTNLCVSLWGQYVTHLPIDFQIQPQSLANGRYPGANRRNAIGDPYFDRVDNLDPLTQKKDEGEGGGG